MISVVIPTYNTALLIERTIRSVLTQSRQDFEILIVDDCSTDDTLEVVRKIADARIRVFRQPENRGPAAARNRGLAEAKGEYCAFLDGDDYWEPEFLRETADFLGAHPGAVAVSVMQCHKIIGKEPVTAPRDTGVTEPVVLPDFFDFWAKYNHVCTGSALMRTAVARRLGGQRENLRVCEDLEFWALLATQGSWGFIPKVLFTSDGGLITRKTGNRKKNALRLACIKNIEEWGGRLMPLLNAAQREKMVPVFNRITLPGTYSLLYIGKYREAYRNISFYMPQKGRKNPIPVRVAALGPAVWLLFAWAYRCYRLIKDFRNGVH